MGPAFHTTQLTRPYISDGRFYLCVCHQKHQTFSFSFQRAPVEYNLALQEREIKAMAEVFLLFFFNPETNTHFYSNYI